MSHHHQYTRHMSNPFGCIIFLVAAFLIFFYQEWNYTTWIPALFVILILGSCIMTAIRRRRRAQAQVAANTPSPASQTDPPLKLSPFNYNPTQLSSRSDSEFQRVQSSPTPPQKMMKLCSMCGAPLDDEILKQLIISGRGYCKYCGNQIQK